MRRALTWLGGAVGLAALARLRSRRRAAPAGVPVEADPANELRRKLADQRSAGAEPVDSESEADEPEANPDPIDLEERRSEVHARAQEAIDRMRDVETEGEGTDDDSVA